MVDQYEMIDWTGHLNEKIKMLLITNQRWYATVFTCKKAPKIFSRGSTLWLMLHSVAFGTYTECVTREECEKTNEIFWVQLKLFFF